MKLKKGIAAALMAVMMVGALSACSGGGDNAATSNPPATTAPQTDSGQAAQTAPAAPVTMDTVRVWSDNAHEKDLRMQQIAAFNAGEGKELGITIDYVVYGTNWEDTIKIAAQAGEAPDLFRPNGTILKNFVDAGYLVPISDLPGSEAFLAKYDGILAVNQHIFKDKPYTIPYNLTTYKFVINRDIFDKNGLTEAPKTWAQVREYAKIITDNGGGTEFGYALGLQSPWTATSYFTRPTGADVSHFGFDNRTLKFDFSSMAPKLEAITGMVKDGSVMPGASGMDADAMRAQFAEGRVGMLPAVSFDVGVYNDQFPAKCNWEVVSIPTMNDGPAPYKELCDATNLLGVGVAALETPEHAAKVMKVLEFFYSDENAAQMYEESLYIPFRAEAIAMAKKQPERKGFREFANVPDKMLMLPMPDTFITVEGTNITDTITNLCTNNPDMTATAGLADLDKRYNDALAAQLGADVLETFRAPAGRVYEAGK